MTIEEAEKYEEQELYDKAYEEYKKMLKNRPNSTELLQRTGHIAEILGKTDEAEQYFSDILNYDKTNTLAYEQLMDLFEESDRYKYYTYRGNLHICQNQLSHAVNDFKKALSKAPDENRANATRFILADIYSKIGKENSAIDEYLRIIDSKDAPEETYLNLSKLYVSQDVLSSAIEILERAIKDGHETSKIKETLAELYLKNNQNDKAVKISSDKLVQLKCLIEEEKFDEAFNKLQEMHNDYKKNPKYLSLVAEFHYVKKDFEKALESVDEFAKFDKNSPLIYQMRALIYEETGDNYKEHFNWAKYNLLRGNKDVALNEYMYALQHKEDDTALLLTIAELSEDMGNKNQANEFYEKLHKYEPNNKKALEKLGLFRESIGDYKMALKYLEELYNIDNRNSILKSLANCYEHTHNKEKALEFYEKYLSSASIQENEITGIKKKIQKLENNKKSYSEAGMEEEGLIDKLIRWFGK